MKNLFILLFAFIALSVNAQETPSNNFPCDFLVLSGDAEIKAAFTQFNANDVTLRTGITDNTTLAATNQGLNKLMVDTVELYTFTVGYGNAVDSIEFITTREYDPVYLGGSDSAKVTELRCAMQTGSKVSGTDTVDVQISWHATFLSGSAVKLNTADLPVESITTGTVDTSFDNATIPPGVFIWGTVPAVVNGRKPKQLVCTVSGYYAD